MRATLAIGASGYGLYIGSLYSTVVQTSQARENFVIAAGALLGACAGLLWTAQGAIMLAYATERTKGRYVALFWSVFNCVSTRAGFLPTLHQDTDDLCLGRCHRCCNSYGNKLEPSGSESCCRIHLHRLYGSQPHWYPHRLLPREAK